MKMKRISNTYNINKPRPRNGHKYRKCFSITILIRIKQQLSSTFEAKLMKKLSNPEVELKKSVAYKRACISQSWWNWWWWFCFWATGTVSGSLSYMFKRKKVKKYYENFEKWNRVFIISNKYRAAEGQRLLIIVSLTPKLIYRRAMKARECFIFRITLLLFFMYKQPFYKQLTFRM